MNIKKIFRSLVPMAAVLVLSGCGGARASANIVINPDSTIQVEEIVLVDAHDGDKDVDLNASPYSAMKPTAGDTYYETVEQRETTIDGTDYIGYYSKTNLMTLADYSQWKDRSGESAFAPRIQIVKTGIPFVRVAKVDASGLLDQYKEKYSLDGSSIKVNISVPGTVTESNQTSIDEKTGAYVWENEDCNDISITFRYLDMSGGAKKILAVVVVLGYTLVGLAVLNAFTKIAPKKSSSSIPMPF